MPVKSKKQLRLLEGIAHGDIKPRPGLPTVAQAKKFLADSGPIPKDLPTQVKKKKKKDS